jgi:deoxyribodipyrimidine photolyase-related protein
MTPDPGHRHILVLGDQLSSTLGPVASADPTSSNVILIESAAWARRRRYHKQKLLLLYSAMRYYALELRSRGFEVIEYRVEAFEEGLERHLAAWPGAHIELMEPAKHGLAERLRTMVERAGGELRVLPNALWLSDAVTFDQWAGGRRTFRLEHWYRRERRRTGWLMDGDGQPEGGSWNLDRENRRSVPPGTRFTPPPLFPPDEWTHEVGAWVEQAFTDHPGRADAFGWPVTRADALLALQHFVEHRLRDFGPYQDAMLDGERTLAHSLLSVPLNLGLLGAHEVCEAALAAYADPERRGDPAHAIPLASIEGFIRQLLGWREFLRHMYRRRMPAMAQVNALGHDGSLPGLYWTADTRMRCLGESVRSVLETGHAHHISRLMVLGNWALLAGVDPRAVNAWFLEMFVDAFDWVVTPNVMGMSQWADQSFTSKPYVSGGAYIDRMSDHCGHCPYDPRHSSGPDACPFSSLYWDFIDRHADRLGGNARMGNAVRAWQRRDPDDRTRILERAASVRRMAAADEL